MKKILAVLLALLFAFSFAACGDKPAEYPDTLGYDLLTDFEAALNEDGSMGTQALADRIITNPAILFAGATMPVEPGFLSGFSAEITGFEEAVMFGPAIGTIPFVGYIFKLSDASEAEGFMETLKANADPRWNICTEAEETVVGAKENMVFFVMCPKTLEE